MTSQHCLAIIAACTAAFALTACTIDPNNPTATGSQQLGMAAFKVAVNARCYNDIGRVSAWNTATRNLSADQKQALQGEVCSCVADKAPTATNTLEVTTAAIDPQARNTIAAQVVTRTVNACIVEASK